MADIKVSVKNDLFSIVMDTWEWASLTVNGSVVNPINSGNIQFEYTQSTSGIIHFIATANQNIDITNPGNSLFMKSSDGEKSYIMMISYSEKSSVVTLNGFIHTLPFVFSEDKPSPLSFSQGRMTGTFETI
jgi:hypothetical protein